MHLSDGSASPWHFNLPQNNEAEIPREVRKIHVYASTKNYVHLLAFYDGENNLLVKAKGGQAFGDETKSEFIVPEGHKLIGVQTTHRNDDHLVGIGFLTVP